MNEHGQPDPNPPPDPAPIPTRSASEDPDAQPPAPAPPRKRRRSLFARFGGSVRRLGVDALSVALGKLIEPPETEAEEPAAPPSGSDPNNAIRAEKRRVYALHQVTERLRGAADTYIAAKLDEIEARVDLKLDQINSRIDEKIRALQAEMERLRDAELRHRLRILKLTLVFTALVALLSLAYNWISGMMAGP